MRLKLLVNDKGIAPIFVLIAAIGLISFLAINSTSSFKNNVFSTLYPKKSSLAATNVQLSLTPSTNSVLPSQTFNLEVMIEPQGEPVTAADIQVNFDPNLLQATGVQVGTILPTVLIQPIISPGLVSFTLGANPGTALTTGGVLATISFTALQISASPTQVNFNSNTQVAALNNTGNVVGVLNSSTITISNQASPNPSPSITPLATPTPIPTPTSTPSSDTTLPAVSITNPINGATFKAGSRINIDANASDNKAVARVEFWVNGSLKCTDSTTAYSCSWKMPGKRNTSYVLQARVFDTSNNSSTHSITIKSQ